MKKNVLPLFLIFIASLLCSCSSITKITGTWKKPAYTGTKFNKILVVAITNDTAKRKSVETSMKRTLADHKIIATTSENIIDFSKVDKNNNGRVDSSKRIEVFKMLKDGGYDGAIVISLLDIKEQTKYVPGETSYRPTYYNPYDMRDYNGIYDYASQTYEVVTTPGYYIKTKTIYIETRLFDLNKDEMLWASKSVTDSPIDIDDFSMTLSDVIVHAMIKDAVIK
jgi:hypothetical protein